MKQIGLFISFLLLSSTVFGQNVKFDRLEMYFAQGHYKKVYRKADRLLDDPANDFSYLPKYYKSLSLLQMSQNSYWLKKHPNALDEAKSLFVEVKNSPSGKAIFEAHMYELSWVKNDLVSWAADLKRQGDDSGFKHAQELIDVLFEEIDVVEGNSEVVVAYIDSTKEENLNLDYRGEIVLTAKQQIGVPYVWAGNSPDGFDCSGFTSFVMSKNGKSLPRRAEDQYNDSKRVKAKYVQPGDLVFFDNGSGISHVGIVVSERGEPLHMIHSSSSKGIILTNISKSEYWTKRLYGFGTYVD